MTADNQPVDAESEDCLQEDRLLERVAMLDQRCRELEARLVRDRRVALLVGTQALTLFRSPQHVFAQRLISWVRQKLGRRPDRHPIDHYLDAPATDSTLFGSLEIYGWAFSHLAGIDRVEVWLNSRLLGTVSYGLPRADAAAFLGNAALRHCGYSGRFVVPHDLDPAQPQQVSVRVIDALGQVHQIDRSVLLSAASYQRWLEAEHLEYPIVASDTSDMPFYHLVAYVGVAQPATLAPFIASIVAQSYAHWQLELVCDREHASSLASTLNQSDPRILVRAGVLGDCLSADGHPSQPNSYTILLHPATILAPQALGYFATAALQQPAPDVMYCDHDRLMPDGSRAEPSFKPDWSIEYFRQSAYICAPLAVRTSIAGSVVLITPPISLDALVYQFLLVVAEQTNKIVHIPQILCHYMHDRTTSEAVRAERIASLGAHLVRLGITGAEPVPIDAAYLTMRPLPISNGPLVSIVIPTRNAPHLIKRCLQTIYAKTTYRPFEVILVDNETNDPIALEIMKRYPVVRVSLPNPFNYSRANNLGVRHARGEYFIFLNNDTEVVSPDWIEHLLYYAKQPDVGAVGALLLYPNQTIQHIGVVLGMNGIADHVLRGFPLSRPPLDDALVYVRERSAVTAACLMMKRTDYEHVGGFDEHFGTHLQDVDLCMKLRMLGRRNLVDPGAVLIHHESVTRSYEPDVGDDTLLVQRWREQIIASDPFFHPSYDRNCLNLALQHVRLSDQ